MCLNLAQGSISSDLALFLSLTHIPLQFLHHVT